MSIGGGVSGSGGIVDADVPPDDDRFADCPDDSPFERAELSDDADERWSSSRG